jgi:hypothetical protein
MGRRYPATYATLQTAKIAINREELGREIVRYDKLGDDKPHKLARVMPVVLVDDSKRAQQIKRMGFYCEVKPTQFCEGATVRLKDSVPKERMGELATIVRFLTGKPAAAYLDRPIGGTRYWDLQDLVLIAPGEAG